ncbi:hypothetical protein AcV7_006859 [Taiwanofungus camphoratus]|nr:hypothetical protein AcV7_006859 [Antrodia cinnamomea]
MISLEIAFSGTAVLTRSTSFNSNSDQEMLMLDVITLYDIPGNCTRDGAWSPNTWKTRFALSYKGLHYKTVWVEYPDIASVCKEIGAAPTGTREDGSLLYTLPVIYDPLTKKSISESGRIARYLDKTYPDTPVLIPAGTDAFHAAFQDALHLMVEVHLSPLMIPSVASQLNPASAVYFRRTREERVGKLEELSPPGPIRERRWKQVEDGFAKIAAWMSMQDEEKPFIMGDSVCCADFSIASLLVWIRRVLGSDGPEWAAVKTWNGGKWGRFMENFEKYEVMYFHDLRRTVPEVLLPTPTDLSGTPVAPNDFFIW